MRSLWCRGRTIPWPAPDAGPVTAAPIPLGHSGRRPGWSQPRTAQPRSGRRRPRPPRPSGARAYPRGSRLRVRRSRRPLRRPRHRSRHVQRRENSRRHVPPDTGRPLCSISETYNLDSRASWYVTGFHHSWSESLCMSLSALHVHATDAESRVEQNRTIWNAKSKFRADVRSVTPSLVSGPSPAVDGAFPISAAPLAVDGVRSCGGVEWWVGQREGNRNDVVIDIRLLIKVNFSWLKFFFEVRVKCYDNNTVLSIQLRGASDGIPVAWFPPASRPSSPSMTRTGPPSCCRRSTQTRTFQ